MRVYVTTMPDTIVAIIHIAPARELSRAEYDNDEDFLTDVAFFEAQHARRLPKTMFELSRIANNRTQHFDWAIHSLEAIALGLPGHFPLACVEMDDATFPPDRSQRNDWEISGDTIRVREIAVLGN